MNKVTLLIIILFSCFTHMATSQDHGDHSHGEEATKTSESVKPIQKSMESNSEKYEVLVKWVEIHASEIGELDLFLSEFNTNIPITDAKITISIKEDPSIKLSVDKHEPGIYHLNGTFPKDQNYTFIVNIDGSKGIDQIQLSPLSVGHHPEELAIADEHSHSHPHTHFYTSVWFLLLMGLLGGMLLMYLIFNSKDRSKTLNTIAIVMVCLSIPIPLAEIRAHGDDGKSTKAPSGNQFLIPKETQFLFDIQTQKMTDARFSEAIKLYGTIVPSSAGRAEVSAPFIGKVTSLRVSVGQQVIAGQVLAVLEQYIDANTQAAMASKKSSDANIESERNTLEAELDAATKDYFRMKKIEDIAAKKEVDEAEARYKKSVQNLDVFTIASQAGKAGINKFVTLTSPISGVLDQFSITKGSTINLGQALFTITNLSKVYIDAQVYDKDIDKIKDAKKFMVTCTNSDHQSSSIKLISKAQAINPTNQSQRFIFELSNPDGDFKIGEFVNLMAFTDIKQNTLAVPNSALNEINGKPILFIKNKAEQYDVVYLSIGDNNGLETIVHKGIQHNERVVINGSYQMKMMYLNQ